MSVFFARNSTRADLSLGRWPATITCFFSGRTAYSVPSLAFRRAGLPSCASQQKSDGHQLPCGGLLPEHGATTLNSFASKQTTGYAAIGSRRGITLSFFVKICACSELYRNIMASIFEIRNSNFFLATCMSISIGLRDQIMILSFLEWRRSDIHTRVAQKAQITWKYCNEITWIPDQPLTSRNHARRV